MVKIKDETRFRDAVQLLEYCDLKLSRLLEFQDVGKRLSLIPEELSACHRLVALCGLIVNRVISDSGDREKDCLDFVFRNHKSIVEQIINEANDYAKECDEENSTDE